MPTFSTEPGLGAVPLIQPHPLPTSCRGLQSRDAKQMSQASGSQRPLHLLEDLPLLQERWQSHKELVVSRPGRSGWPLQSHSEQFRVPQQPPYQPHPAAGPRQELEPSRGSPQHSPDKEALG